MKKINLLIIPLVIALSGCGKQNSSSDSKIYVEYSKQYDGLAEAMNVLNDITSYTSDMKLKLTEKGYDLAMRSDFSPCSPYVVGLLFDGSYDLDLETKMSTDFENLVIYNKQSYKGNVSDCFKQKNSVEASHEQYITYIEKDYSGTKYYDFYAIDYDKDEENPTTMVFPQISKVSDFYLDNSELLKGVGVNPIIGNFYYIAMPFYNESSDYVEIVDENTYKFVYQNYDYMFCDHPDARKNNAALLVRSITTISLTITKSSNGFVPSEIFRSDAFYLVEDEKTGDYIDKPILLDYAAERIHDFGYGKDLKLTFPMDDYNKYSKESYYPNFVDLNTESMLSLSDVTDLYKLSNKYDGSVYYAKVEIDDNLLPHEFSFTTTKYIPDHKFDKYGMDKIDSKNIYVSPVEGSQTKFKFKEQGEYAIRVFVDKEDEITKIEIERIYHQLT